MTKCVTAAMILTVLSVVGGCAQSVAADGAASLQGTWETVRLVSNDKETPARKEVTVTFEGDKMITKRKGKVLSTWNYKVDDSKEPKQLTINTAEPGGKERLSHLIYKIEGDTLITCAGRTYPQEFTTKTEQGYYYTERRRVKE